MYSNSKLKTILYNSFYNEMQKQSGVISEVIGMANPLNIFAHIPASIIALATPTKTKEEMKEQQGQTWSNILVPGLANYNMYKRLGYTQEHLKIK